MPAGALFAEALPFAEKSYLLAPHLPHSASILAGLRLRTGDETGAEKMIEKLGPGTAFGIPRAFAFFHIIAGQTEEAADWCERAIEQRDGTCSFITALPCGSRSAKAPAGPIWRN